MCVWGGGGGGRKGGGGVCNKKGQREQEVEQEKTVDSASVLPLLSQSRCACLLLTFSSHSVLW